VSKASAVAAGFAVLLLTPLLAFMAMGDPPPANEPSPTAVADIPAELLGAYRAAAAACAVPWEVLAAVGKVASDHGRSPTPGFPDRAGPMGLLPAVWAAGQGDAPQPADAIRASAAFLCARGATDPDRLPTALAALDPAADVARILAIAQSYRTPTNSVGP
jgi:hypothetical protein